MDLIGALVIALSVISSVVWLLREIARVLRAEMGGVKDALMMAAEASRTDPGPDLDRRLKDLEDAIDRLPSKWEEIKREAQSFYNRATHHVRRARKELEESGFRDPELDEIAQFDLLEGDARGSGEEGVHPLPTHVAANGLSSEPEHLANARAAGLDPVTLAMMGGRP